MELISALKVSAKHWISDIKQTQYYYFMTEQSKEIKRFIKNHSSLFWYIKEDAKESISTEFLVETILNYGELKDVKKMLALLGTKRTAEIFFKQTHNKRCNYFPKVKYYFTLYFNRHA